MLLVGEALLLHSDYVNVKYILNKIFSNKFEEQFQYFITAHKETLPNNIDQHSALNLELKTSTESLLDNNDSKALKRIQEEFKNLISKYGISYVGGRYLKLFRDIDAFTHTNFSKQQLELIDWLISEDTNDFNSFKTIEIDENIHFKVFTKTTPWIDVVVEDTGRIVIYTNDPTFWHRSGIDFAVCHNRYLYFHDYEMGYIRPDSKLPISVDSMIAEGSRILSVLKSPFRDDPVCGCYLSCYFID